jgi:hypothetical protein
VSVLKAHLRQQAKARPSLGDAWVDAGRVFTQPDGRWIHPAWLSDHFDRLVKYSGLPPYSCTTYAMVRRRSPLPPVSK